MDRVPHITVGDVDGLEQRLNALQQGITTHHKALFFILHDILIPHNLCVISRAPFQNGVPSTLTNSAGPRLLYHVPSRTLWILRGNGYMEQIMQFSEAEVRGVVQAHTNRPTIGPASDARLPR